MWFCEEVEKNGHQRVLTLIKREISYYQLVKFDKVEGLSVTVDTISAPLDIVNVYCPPQESFDGLGISFNGKMF